MTRDIHILLFEEAVLSSTAAPLDMFSRTNDILAGTGQPPAFSVATVGGMPSTIALGTLASFSCTQSLDELLASRRPDRQALIVVPAFSGDWSLVLDSNPGLPGLLKQHYEAGTEIASLCRGSYFLAEAGLLDDVPCTSHWASIDDMRQRYPRARLQPDAVVTDHDGLYTGGGAFSSLNLILYLVEKFCGHDIGIQVAKNFSIQRDHVNQSHFAMFTGLNQHDDELIQQAQDHILQHYRSIDGVDEVASLVNMSRRNFIRRFKQAVNLTPLEFIQRVRVEAAKKALETNQQNIELVLIDVGYNDIKTFRQTFKRYTGLTPKDYRRKYGRPLSVSIAD